MREMSEMITITINSNMVAIKGSDKSTPAFLKALVPIFSSNDRSSLNNRNHG
jgi:hypothetical protein